MTGFSLSLRSWLQRYWPETLAVVAPLAVYWQITLGGQVLYWGLPSLQFVPWRVLVNQAFSQGHLPLWTSLLGMGAPVLANYQSAALYPPNWLALILPPETAISWLAVLHLSLAGLGLVRLARVLGLHAFGAAIAGLSFGLSGYLTGRLWFITINNAIVWLPWVLLLAPPGWGRSYPLSRWLALTGVLVMQLLSGHAQSTYYTLLLAGVWIIWRTVWAEDSVGRSLTQTLRGLAVNLGGFALAVILALAVSVLQLIPTYELLSLSPRASAADYDFVMQYSLWPWRVLTWVVPNLFGHPADQNYLGYATYWEDNAYLGLLPVVFAFYALYRALRLAFGRMRHVAAAGGASQPNWPKGLLPLLVTLATVSVVLALGKNTPIFPFLYRYLPTFNLFQAPARLLIWYTFALSLLAGLGAELWLPSDSKRYWSRLGIAGSLGMVALGVGGALTATNPKVIVFASAIAWAAATGAVAFVILLLQNASWRWQALALALVILDTGLAAVRATPVTDRSLYQQAPAYSAANGRSFEYAKDEYRVKFQDLLRFQSFDPLNKTAYRDSLLTNLNVLTNQASVNNFDPLLPDRYAQFLVLLEQNPRLLDLADVTAIVKPSGAVTLRNSDLAARLRVVYQAKPVESVQAAAAAIAAPTFDPDQTVVLEDMPASAKRFGLAWESSTYTESVTLKENGYVVLSDTYYPGWRAKVDGQAQPLSIADLNFWAVAVPAGSHTVTMEYAPFSVTLGLGISIMGLLVWLGLAAWAWWSARRETVL